MEKSVTAEEAHIQLVLLYYFIAIMFFCFQEDKLLAYFIIDTNGHTRLVNGFIIQN
jgi:hypothetical protein